MLGIHVKRGVESTLERVFANSGERMGKLSVAWTGKTAGIIFERMGNILTAKVIFPAIDEVSEIPRSRFNNMIGYALHELGHAWFTENEFWDEARKLHGGFVSNLINGLEDPRIERKVIESGFAPNSRALFEELINNVLDKDGYVEPDDLKNIPFMLAVEGRRLNGYHIDVPSILDDCPYVDDVRWALETAHHCASTHGIVQVAIELYKRLQSESKSQPPVNTNPDPKGKKGGDSRGKPSNANDQDGDQDGDEGDGQGGDDKPSDAPPSKPKRSNFEGGRDVEPTNFIEDELSNHSSQADDWRPRPAVGKPNIRNFVWR
jgi:hypothetical protein